jgi:hypothetical protein
LTNTFPLSYGSLLWFFAIGAIAPIPFYFLACHFPLSFWRYINFPVFFGSVGAFAVGSSLTFTSWVPLGFIFNFYIRRFHFRWWMRHNYILSAALDAGVGLCTIVIFFAVQYPKGGFKLKWWGNSGKLDVLIFKSHKLKQYTVWMNTADVNGTPLYVTNPGQTFGPTSWS